MPSNPELSALETKLTESAAAGSSFSPRERDLLARGLQRLEDDPDLAVTPWRREIDFFLVCLGYCLLAFAVLVLMRWSASAPLGAPGAFGVAFVTGLSAVALQRYYPRAKTGDGPWWPVVLAGVALVASLVALIATGQIGGVLGLVLGAVFFQALRRQRDSGARAGSDGQPA